MIESFINNQSKALMKKIYIAAFFQIELSILHKKTNFYKTFARKFVKTNSLLKKFQNIFFFVEVSLMT